MSPPAQRTRSILVVLAVVMALNLAVAAAKLLYGRFSGALAISADGLHSLLDASSNVIGLIGVGVSRRPADENHPYGHRKYETFAALSVAVLMFAGCWEIGAAALDRVRHPHAPVVTGLGFAILLATMAVNLGVTLVEGRLGRRLQSEMLVADAAHTGSDLLASAVVLASFAAIRIGVPWADVTATGLVVVLILRAGWHVLQGTLSTLSDERRIEPELVERAALEEPGVREVHNVRSRGTLDDVHVDLHVLVDPGMRIADAHAVGHRVEALLRRRWPAFSDVVVHVEPALESERATGRRGGGLTADA
jgi:cation diffusion facilitator family transporter